MIDRRADNQKKPTNFDLEIHPEAMLRTRKLAAAVFVARNVDVRVCNLDTELDGSRDTTTNATSFSANNKQVFGELSSF